MSTLERAISISAQAHENQVDKAGAPYILHSLRVMLRLDTTEERIAGVLHDVVEDTSISIEFLRNSGFSETILLAIESVTKRQSETYDKFVLRASANAIGRRVKLADLSDNSDLSRISNPTAEDFKRVEKYQRAIKTLNNIDPANAKPIVQPGRCLHR
jgi:(p)ppGpp synthase/HD superfamily hydrolase